MLLPIGKTTSQSAVQTSTLDGCGRDLVTIQLDVTCQTRPSGMEVAPWARDEMAALRGSARGLRPYQTGPNGSSSKHVAVVDELLATAIDRLRSVGQRQHAPRG